MISAVQLSHRGAYVGDGVDPAPALARAGVVLAPTDLRNVLGVIELCEASYRTMLQHLGWAASCNEAGGKQEVRSLSRAGNKPIPE